MRSQITARLRCCPWRLTASLWLLFSCPIVWGQPPAAEKANYLGNDVCVACHEFPNPIFFDTAHGEQECESCHGVGTAHVEAGGDDPSVSFTKNSAGWAADRCLLCHETLRLATTFGRSGHGRSEIGCNSCHRIHPEKSVSHLLKVEATELCASCHSNISAAFRKPYRHPVLEGAMECSDCHNPHADELPALRRASGGTDDGCVKCHASKAGPFVFEHLPVESDGCQSCHSPHGSVNPKMLVRSEVHQLCLECHSNTSGVLGGTPFAFHDIRSPRYRNCTVCHREIHGSNASPTFLR